MKIYVQIRRFTWCLSVFEHRFKLENTYNELRVIYMTLQQKEVQTQLIILLMLLFAKMLCTTIMLWRHYGV